MEDDEEFSYKSVSAETAAALGENRATFVDSEEVYTYSGYADEAALAEAAEERTQSYGDFLIEEFSAETNVPRVAKMTKIPSSVVTWIFAVVYFAVGVLCIAMPDNITEALPYVVGTMMTVIGLVRFIIAVVRREYRHLKTNQTATSLIMTALGVMIMIQQFDAKNDSAIMLISVVWGILGLFEAAHAFNHAFKRIANSERYIYYLVKGIVECVVAFMLLYQPDNHAAHHFHIIVFGVNLLIDAVTMIPKVRDLLAKK